MDRQIPIPCAVEQLALAYKERAQVLRECLYDDEAARCEQTAEEILEAKAKDDELLLSEGEALEYSRGYTSDHLRRTVPNTTDKANGKRRYRKRDLPRKSGAPNQTVEHTDRGTRIRIDD